MLISFAPLLVRRFWVVIALADVGQAAAQSGVIERGGQGPFEIRVEEFFEALGDANTSADDNDRIVLTPELDPRDDAFRAIPDPAHLTRAFDDPGYALGGIDLVGRDNELPIRGLSGLAWGGYTAATGSNPEPPNAPPGRGIRISNIEGIGETDLLRDTFSNSFLTFFQHATSQAHDFPQNYNERTGSYVYTLFGKDASPNSGPEAIDLRRGVFKIAINKSQDDPIDQGGSQVSPVPPQKFHILIQTEGYYWWRSVRLDQAGLPRPSGTHELTPQVNFGVRTAFGAGDFNDPTQEPRPSDEFSKADREALMSEHLIGELGWERIGAAAEANMSFLSRGGESPLGIAQTRGALGTNYPFSPNLGYVTGMGVVVSELTEGRSLNPLAPDAANIIILGMVLLGNVAQTDSAAGDWPGYQ